MRWQYLRMSWSSDGSPRKVFDPKLPDEVYAKIPDGFSAAMNTLGEMGWEAYAIQPPAPQYDREYVLPAYVGVYFKRSTPL